MAYHSLKIYVNSTMWVTMSASPGENFEHLKYSNGLSIRHFGRKPAVLSRMQLGQQASHGISTERLKFYINLHGKE